TCVFEGESDCLESRCPLQTTGLHHRSDAKRLGSGVASGLLFTGAMTSPLPKNIRRELARIGYKNPDRQDLATFQKARGLAKATPGVVDASTKKALDFVAK